MKPYSISATGSSPLARGLLLLQQVEAVQAGIIPARAGFTPPRPARGTHPCGSSPLARGLQYRRARDEADGRIIPARAGFTRPPMAERSGVSDHPRSRGVYFRELWIKGLPAGSSPLARGLRRRRAVGLRRGGIIPARAGFTPRPPCRRPSRPDHPRSRGVYLLQAVMIVSFLGSSPLARGLPAWCGPCCLISRIIPARAGFTDIPCTRTEIGMGSSPLARGLLAGSVAAIGTAGIIPARAGFTAVEAPTRQHPQDHPRSRGVYG